MPHDAANKSHVSPALAGKKIWQVTVWRVFRAAAEIRCGRNPRRRRAVEYIVSVLGCPVSKNTREKRRWWCRRRDWTALRRFRPVSRVINLSTFEGP
jgi:hypothetical protein